MGHSNTRCRLLGTTAAVVFLWPQIAAADYALNMTRGVTELSREFYDLHMLIFYICCAIAAVVFGVMFWSIFNHRKSRGAVAAQFHHSTRAELIWTIIPIIILVGMAVPATKALVKMESTGDADMTIKVTGHQWKWRYDYVEPGFGFFSALAADSNEARALRSGKDPGAVDNYLLNVDHPLVVPVGKKIRFLTTANDVVHAWWVPALGWKRDAIPGYINESWARVDEPGIYRGQCAELCGKDHGFMPVVLKAVPEDEYFAWVEEMVVAQADASAGADRDWTREELMAKGEQVYTAFCAACHQPNGLGIPPAFPALAGGAIATGPVDQHLDRVINGKPGTAMAAFGGQLNDVDLAAVVTYERNAFGNSAGDVLQPAAVKAARK
ncbi:MAG: cytochrome c oxidase subunit II [Gammaproteobacteria bacterium]|nr:cytochrome c oxidase subunit II [Gammaproteobacteria bacterium]